MWRWISGFVEVAESHGPVKANYYLELNVPAQLRGQVKQTGINYMTARRNKQRNDT